MYSLIETAKLKGLEPQLYLTDVLIRIATTPPGKSPIYCPGTGSLLTAAAPLPELAPSPSAYGA